MAVTTAGLNLMLQKLGGFSGTVFDNTNAYIGVGDSSTAFSAGQTDLQAATNHTRVVMDATFPTQTTNVGVYKATFSTGTANYAWNEWGIFNNSSGGTMLSRKVESLGTKTSAQTWVITATLTWAVA